MGETKEGLMCECTLYIDESGDEGIQNTASNCTLSGSKPFFTLGACLVRDSNRDVCAYTIEKCERTLNCQLHFSQIKHEKRQYAYTEISKLPVMFFGLISDKTNLDVGGYRSIIEGKKGFFYNKNIHYLLEMVGRFCCLHGHSIKKVIFDKIEGKNYDQMRNYLRTISNKPLHHNANFLEVINPSVIYAESSMDFPLLKLCDAVSYSIYRTCTTNRYGLTEDAYLRLLSKKFYATEEGFIRDVGLKAVPRGFSSLPLKLETRNFLLGLKEYHPPSLKKVKPLQLPCPPSKFFTESEFPETGRRGLWLERLRR